MTSNTSARCLGNLHTRTSLDPGTVAHSMAWLLITAMASGNILFPMASKYPVPQEHPKACSCGWYKSLPTWLDPNLLANWILSSPTTKLSEARSSKQDQLLPDRWKRWGLMRTIQALQFTPSQWTGACFADPTLHWLTSVVPVQSMLKPYKACAWATVFALPSSLARFATTWSHTWHHRRELPIFHCTHRCWSRDQEHASASSTAASLKPAATASLEPFVHANVDPNLGMSNPSLGRCEVVLVKRQMLDLMNISDASMGDDRDKKPYCDLVE